MRYYSYRIALLGGLGAPAGTQQMRFLEAWAVAEGGTARFNAWNTTLKLAGSYDYNGVGVQNYLDSIQGNAATLLTIRLAYYQRLVAALRAGNLTAEEITRQSRTALATWGTGADAVLAVLARR